MVTLPESKPYETLEEEEEEGEEQEYTTVTEYVGEEPEPAEDVALFVESRRGKTVLQYNGHRYRKAYKSKNGVRWNCSLNKNCSAFLFLNDNDEILMSNEDHDHPQSARLENVDTDQTGKISFY